MNQFYRLKAPILFLDRHSLPDRNGEYYEQIFPKAPNQPPRFSLGATNVDSMHSPPAFFSEGFSGQFVRGRPPLEAAFGRSDDMRARLSAR